MKMLCIFAPQIVPALIAIRWVIHPKTVSGGCRSCQGLTLDRLVAWLQSAPGSRRRSCSRQSCMTCYICVPRILAPFGRPKDQSTSSPIAAVNDIYTPTECNISVSFWLRVHLISCSECSSFVLDLLRSRPLGHDGCVLRGWDLSSEPLTLHHLHISQQ